MKLNIAGIQNDSIVDGPGIRYAIFVQGCPHHCEGCHNPETWEFGTGRDVTLDEIMEKIKEDPLLDGVTYSGGEPFTQCHALCELTDRIRRECPKLTVMSYTGYTIEQLIKQSTPENGFMELLGRLDYLVDGPFVLSLKSYELKFKGSSNQRFLDVTKTLAEGRPIPYHDDWENIEIKLV